MDNIEEANAILNEDLSQQAAYEMAFSRADAIERCISLGNKFVEHFKKICSGDSESFIHHCGEMQVWWKDVLDIKLKQTNRNLTKGNIFDWFLTVGKSTEDLFTDPNMLEMYENFIIALLANPQSQISDLLGNCLK